VHKTLPTNSGYDLNGAEELARSLLGMNAMNPKCSASLMLEISQGKISADARRYMLQILNHQRESSYSSYGLGTPPGSLIYNKVGNAYDTLQEIAYIILPNEQPFILSTFTNGYESSEPAINNLMYFAELLIESIPQLNHDLPSKYVFDCTSKEFYKTGSSWHQGTARDSYGDYFYYNTNPSGQHAGWKFTVAQDGIYEVAVWHPEFSTQASDVQHTVYHRDGTDTFRVNERHNGGRWVKLGDFNFSAGVVSEVRVIAETSEVKSVAVDSLRVAMYPFCNSIPGTSCVATIML
jgi:protein phosphatase methylesterase 1